MFNNDLNQEFEEFKHLSSFDENDPPNWDMDMRKHRKQLRRSPRLIKIDDNENINFMDDGENNEFHIHQFNN